MGQLVSVGECKYWVELPGKRKWSYTDTLKPDRRVILKEGGEWLGWIEKGEKNFTIQVLHGLGKSAIVRTRFWRKRGEQWEQVDDEIIPGVPEFEIFTTRWNIRAWGTYKVKFQVYTKDVKITRVVTFKACVPDKISKDDKKTQ